MVRVGGSNIYDIDVRVLHEFIVGAVRLGRRGGADLFEELLGAGFTGGAGGRDDGMDDGIYAAGLRVDKEVFGKSLGDAAGGEDAPADGWGSG